jgi:hypothetical protein
VIRLLLIAAAGLGSFFLFMVVVGQFTENNDVAAGVAVGLGFFGVPVLLLRYWRSPNSKCPGGKGLYPECLFTVTVGESEFVVLRPDGQRESLPLFELSKVTIVTNDSGPWGADVWWVMEGATEKSGCSFPQGATGESKVLEYVQGLPAFNNEAFIQAMGCTSNARFICWQKCA